MIMILEAYHGQYYVSYTMFTMFITMEIYVRHGFGI